MKISNAQQKNRKAMALISVLTLLLIFSLLTYSMLRQVTSDLKIQQSQKASFGQKSDLEFSFQQLLNVMTTPSHENSNLFTINQPGLLEAFDDTPLIQKIREVYDPAFEWSSLAAEIHPTLELSLECISERSDDNTWLDGCSADSAHLPKVFSASLGLTDPNTGTHSKLFANFDLDSAKLSDFAIMITGQHHPDGPDELGQVTINFRTGVIDGLVGAYFHPSVSYHQRVVGLLPQNDESLVFQRLFLTNALQENLWPINQFGGYHGVEQGEIQFAAGVQADPTSIQPQLTENFEELAQNPDTLVPDLPRVPPSVEQISDEQVDVRELQNVFVNLGTLEDECEVEVIYDYRTETCDRAIDSQTIYNCGNSRQEIISVFKEALADDSSLVVNRVQDQSAPTYFKTGNPNSVGSVCSNSSIMSWNGGTLSNSIERQSEDPSRGHTALVALNGNFRITGNSLAYSNGQPLADLISSPADELNFRVDTSIVGIQESTQAIQLQDQLMDLDAGKRLGKIEMGQIISPLQPHFNKTFYHGEVRGFETTAYRYAPEIASNAPPGFRSAKVSELSARVSSLSFKHENIDAAIEELANLRED